jgi:hypothetical protein
MKDDQMKEFKAPIEVMDKNIVIEISSCIALILVLIVGVTSGFLMISNYEFKIAGAITIFWVSPFAALRISYYVVTLMMQKYKPNIPPFETKSKNHMERYSSKEMPEDLNEYWKSTTIRGLISRSLNS